MSLDVAAHVAIGASVIGMNYRKVDNLDGLAKYKLREWRGAYGVRPIVCLQAWFMIHKQANRHGCSTIHFYWALHFMKTYKTETEIARHVKTTPKTFRLRVKTIIKLLAGNVHRVVSLFERL